MIFIRRVEGGSMLPTFPAGKVVVAWRFKRPRVGDVVIAKHQKREIIKRVSQIKNGLVYLLGDNPTASTDSRQFGWLSVRAVMGVVQRKRAPIW